VRQWRVTRSNQTPMPTEVRAEERALAKEERGRREAGGPPPRAADLVGVAQKSEEEGARKCLPGWGVRQ
jgi:hypothetical protein